jgi:Sec7-like guanine-nucleotide exchange factor
MQEPGPLANADTAYILAYAIIMLNTDLHNSQVCSLYLLQYYTRTNTDAEAGTNAQMLT